MAASLLFLCLGKSKTQPGWCNLRRGIKEQDAELDGRTRIPRETNFHIKSIEHWHLSKLSSAPHNTGVACVFVSSKWSCTSLLSTLDLASASHVELLELRDTCKEVQTDRKNWKVIQFPGFLIPHSFSPLHACPSAFGHGRVRFSFG